MIRCVGGHLFVRKLFLAHCKLFMDCCHTNLLACEFQAQFDFMSFNLAVLREDYDKFLRTFKSLNDESLLKEFSENVTKRFRNCVKLCKIKNLRFCQKRDNVYEHESNSDIEIKLTPPGCISQASSSYTVASNSSVVALK